MFSKSKFSYREYIDNQAFYNSNGIYLPSFAYELDLKGYESICACDFYEDIFYNTSISLESKRSKDDYVVGEYGAIALEINEKYKKRTTITKDLTELIDLIDKSDNFCLMSPISYAGKNRTNKNMRYMYALVVEIDHLKPNGEGLEELLYSFRDDVRRPNLMPTYMVCSGSGLHLYYKFKEPFSMFDNHQIKLTRIKKTMTFNLWNHIADNKEKIQYESINQSFRIVGTRTKRDSLAIAFKISDNCITINDLEKCYKYDESEYRKKAKYTLAEAEKKFPQWYQTRIIEKQPRKSPQFKKNRAVYDSWKDRILKLAVSGTRYYCMEQLCALAVVCDISREELVKNCYELLPEFDKKTKHEDNPFTEADVKAALATYDNPNDSTYCRKLSTIYKKTNINLPRVRRNGRTQAEHLKRARLIANLVLNEKYPNGEWRYKEAKGQPTKEHLVKKWQKKHPQGTKAQCHKDTKISRPTIDKYWSISNG